LAAQRCAIDRSGLNQVELAEILGVSERTGKVPNFAAYALKCVATLLAEPP